MISLNSQQVEVVDQIVSFLNQDVHRMFLLEGPAGTGKTTCIQEVVKAEPGMSFVMGAPTNKATKVLQEMGISQGTAGVDYRTAYSLLGLRVTKDSEFVRVEALGDSAVMLYNVVVVDEGSMANASLMKYFREAAAACDTKFIFMADRLQLPPVGEDDSEVFSITPRAELTKVERHDNQILTFANSLRECILTGSIPTFKTDNDENGGVYTVDFRRMRNQMVKAYTSEAYEVQPNSCKTVSWRNANVAMYNDLIREAIYGDAAADKFVVEERVVATHPVPNMLGDMRQMAMVTDEEGNVIECDVIQHPMFEDYKVYHLKVETEFSQEWANCFVVHPDSERDYQDKLSQLADSARKGKQPWSSFWGLKNEFMHDIRPCHAITVHRSQGSTYKSVFVDVEDILSNRNRREAMRCLYVAATRASTNLVLKTR